MGNKMMAERSPTQAARRSRLQSRTLSDYDTEIQRLAASYDRPSWLQDAAGAVQSAVQVANAALGGAVAVGQVFFGNLVSQGQASLRGLPGITVDEPVATSHADSRLRDALQQALADPALSIRSIRISDAARDANETVGARNSRHKRGKAIDIDLVDGKSATLGNPAAVKLAEWLIARGFGPGERTGQPGLLFGPVGTRWNSSSFDHSTHLHFSVP